jgi:hypothetical protein
MDSDSSEKFIRTANGPILKDNLKGHYVLPYEHICQNICDFIIPNK